MLTLTKYKSFFLYGIALAILMFVLQFLEYRFILVSHAFEIYISCIAILFTGLGIWLALKLVKPKTKTIIIEKEIPAVESTSEFQPDLNELKKIGLSEREMEVLILIAEGCSTQEIADRLFVSPNTIKTHSSRIFEKLDVKRRTQAVEKARRLKIIA